MTDIAKTFFLELRRRPSKRLYPELEKIIPRLYFTRVTTEEKFISGLSKNSRVETINVTTPRKPKMNARKPSKTARKPKKGSGQRKRCLCDLCTRISPMQKRIRDALPEKLQNDWEYLMMRLMVAEDDGAVAHAKLHGEWPGWEWMKESRKLAERGMELPEGYKWSGKWPFEYPVKT